MSDTKKVTIHQPHGSVVTLWICDECGAAVGWHPHDMRERHIKWHRDQAAWCAQITALVRDIEHLQRRMNRMLEQIAP